MKGGVWEGVCYEGVGWVCHGGGVCHGGVGWGVS